MYMSVQRAECCNQIAATTLGHLALEPPFLLSPDELPSLDARDSLARHAATIDGRSRQPCEWIPDPLDPCQIASSALAATSVTGPDRGSPV